MAGITWGGSSGVWQGANGSGRIMLYDTAGNPMVFQDRTAIGASPFGVPVMGKNDATARVIRVDKYGSVRTAVETLMLHDDVEGATLNTQLWTSTATTMTSSQSATGITLNASAITTINTGIMLVSQKQIPKMPSAPLKFRTRLRYTLVSNQGAEFGFGSPSAVTTVQIANGAFWQITTGGAINPVVAFNGTNVATGTNVAGSLSTSNYYFFDIVVDDDKAIFIVQDASTGAVISEQTLQIPITQQRVWAVTHLPVFYRIYNGGSAPASAGQLIITDTYCALMDVATNKPWSHQLAGNCQGQEVSPTAFTQTHQFANSAAPASATLSNTAAGYTTLGGLWQFAAVAGAATDYCLFGFTVPAPYSFCCTGIRIGAWNTGAAVATTPTLLVWGIGGNGASANLSTGGHLRLPIGSQSFAVGAAVGANVPDIAEAFTEPVRTESGKNFAVILRMPVGSATASQVVAGSVLVKGYFE